MKICPACRIQIGGDRTNCPFCQNALTGQASEEHWPKEKKFRQQALLYKIQLFIVLALIAVSVYLDFKLKLNNGIHYGAYTLAWGLVAEVLIRHFYKHHTFPAKIVTICSIVFSILASVTAYGLGSTWFNIIFYFISPGIIVANIIANLVFALIDKHGDSMIYLFASIVVGILPYIGLKIGHDDKDLFWSISMMVSILVTLALIIFRGKKVRSELQKRFNF